LPLVEQLSSAAGQQTDEFELKKVRVRDDIELSYIEAGEGTPVIFIHGTLGDLYMWKDYVRAFSENYRAIAYSRRYNHPNDNAMQNDHSTAVEGQDLAAFIRKLKLPKAHIVGYSYGGYTALHVAVEHPELVRTLTLAEPPLMPWLKDLGGPRGEKAKEILAAMDIEFRIPARRAIQNGNVVEAVEIFVDHVVKKGAYKGFPAEVRASLHLNEREFIAEVTSAEMFAPLTRAQVGQISAPTLMLSGSNSSPSLNMTDDELQKAMPSKQCRRVVVPGATHAMWLEQPEFCRTTLLDFLRGK
jgi:non-heme chloroperoxidase